MLNFITLPIKKISPKIFIEGGADILTIVNKNHQNDKLGKILPSPFNNNILRVKNRS